MAPGPEKNIEKFGAESSEKSSEQQESPEVLNAVEGSEVAEFIEGNISEVIGEDKKKAPQGGKSGIVKSVSESTAKEKTPPVPSVEVMRSEISDKVKKEVVALERKLRSPGKTEPYDMNNIVSRIRYLRNILAQLAHATSEGVKNLWQKFVKGVSS